MNLNIAISTWNEQMEAQNELWFNKHFIWNTDNCSRVITMKCLLGSKVVNIVIAVTNCYWCSDPISRSILWIFLTQKLIHLNPEKYSSENLIFFCFLNSKNPNPRKSISVKLWNRPNCVAEIFLSLMTWPFVINANCNFHGKGFTFFRWQFTQC